MHLIAVVNKIGVVRYLNKKKEIQKEFTKDTTFETYSEAISVCSSVKTKIEENAKDQEYELKVVPLDLIVKSLGEKTLHQVITTLTDEDITQY